MVTRPIGALIVAALVTSALVLVPAARPAVASRTAATEVNPCAKPLKGGNGPLTYSIALYTHICVSVIEAAAVNEPDDVGVYITEMCGSPGNPGSGPQFGSAVMDAAKLYETYLTEIRKNVLGYFSAELAWYQTKGPAKTRKKVVPILTKLTGDLGIGETAFLMSGFDALLIGVAASFTAKDCGTLHAEYAPLDSKATSAMLAATIDDIHIERLYPFAK